MSTPVTIDLPSGFRLVEWPGRLGGVSAVIGSPRQPRGSALLVPGFTGSKEDYFAVLRPLLEQGWAVAAVDLPGMAASAGPADPAAYTLPLLADDILGMVEEWSAGRPVHLVGHSVGGLIVREAALANPGGIASLTLYCSGPAQVCQAARREIAMLTTALQTATPAQVYHMKEALDAQAGKPKPPDPVAEFLRRRWAQTSAGHLVGMGTIARSAPDRLDALAELTRAAEMPIMVLYGALDNDTWSQADFAHLATTVATRTVVMADVGHSPATEAPAALAAALDSFWTSVS